MPSCFQLILIAVACTSPLTSGFLSTSRPTGITSSGSCASSPTIPPAIVALTTSKTNAISHRTATSQLSLEIPNFFGGGQFNFNPFGDNNDGDEDKSDEKDNSGDTSKYGGGADGAIDSDDDGEWVTTTEIFHIPAKKIKIGGLRLYLALYFMGEQNTPSPKTWRADQTGDGGIDLYFRDRTGALVFALAEEGVTVSRLGSAPSMEYLAQESYILSGMLDQLDEIAVDGSIGEDDRLLCLMEPGDAIEGVRENLAFE